MRLFIGLAIEYHVRRNLELVLEHFRPLAPLDWSPPDNFHITTQFIGEWSEERLTELKEELAAIQSSGSSIEVRIQGLGWFPNADRPRVLFAGVQSGQPLYDLSARLREACTKIGVPVENREYSPHLTLARIKQSSPLTPLRQAIAQLPSDEFGRSVASKFLLYKSESRVYSVVGEFAL